MMSSTDCACAGGGASGERERRDREGEHLFSMDSSRWFVELRIREPDAHRAVWVAPGEARLERLAPERERPADGEIDARHEAVDEERLQRRIVDELAGADQLDEADDRGERGAT